MSDPSPGAIGFRTIALLVVMALMAATSVVLSATPASSLGLSDGMAASSSDSDTGGCAPGTGMISNTVAANPCAPVFDACATAAGVPVGCVVQTLELSGCVTDECVFWYFAAGDYGPSEPTLQVCGTFDFDCPGTLIVF